MSIAVELFSFSKETISMVYNRCAKTQDLIRRYGKQPLTDRRGGKKVKTINITKQLYGTSTNFGHDTVLW